MVEYAELWNSFSEAGSFPINALNLFVKACFIAEKLSGFDLTDLTVNNFGGKQGDLLGLQEPNVYSLIMVTGLPDFGTDLKHLGSCITS